ncbi:MAG: formate dehydrogenase accessory protein FdhE [Actinobacteria bacterium]|nr:formate dehydrogenase accessory protein FdhE [Actinomycetota bacterium]
MSIVIESEELGVQGVRRAVKRYVEMYPEMTDVIEMYGAIMELQQETLGKVTCDVSLDAKMAEAKLSEGTPLIDPYELDIDAERFRALVFDIARIVDEKSPEGFPHRVEIEKWEGLEPGNVPVTRDLVIAGEELEIGVAWESSEDIKLVSNITWEALAPSYMKCGRMHESLIEQSLWQRGACPVCGTRPLMGVFRKEDGLWLLECALCHTRWNVQRARCPFCDEGEQGSLEYLYVGDDRSHRVQYCSACRSYVKTVDMRDSDLDAVLPLEDIATIRLDKVAAKEGLRPAGSRL